VGLLRLAVVHHLGKVLISKADNVFGLVSEDLLGQALEELWEAGRDRQLGGGKGHDRAAAGSCAGPGFCAAPRCCRVEAGNWLAIARFVVVALAVGRRSDRSAGECCRAVVSAVSRCCTLLFEYSECVLDCCFLTDRISEYSGSVLTTDLYRY